MNDKASRIELILPEIERLTASCVLCGNRCAIDRYSGKLGTCRAPSPSPRTLRYSSSTLHFGEEPMLVGRGGSGTVFFTHCNLRCAFCQNHQISQEGMGEEIDAGELAEIFLRLQDSGAENINLVTPTHYIHPILIALREAMIAGLDIPIVYNTNGYDSLELIRLLDGVVDVYLPDMKYMDVDSSWKYSHAKDYPEVAGAAISEMFRQTGEVRVEGGVAKSGLIIRHLILPGDISRSYDFLLWLKDEGMLDATISLMSQYSPQHRAREFPELNKPISMKDYEDLVEYAIRLGFSSLLTQGLESREVFLPDFNNESPFS